MDQVDHVNKFPKGISLKNATSKTLKVKVKYAQNLSMEWKTRK